ncbi:acetyltransferase [Chitinophaga caseinilytica]|uniref:acetyltransferase n=1 Tax=Chitinophaga caseinilytica TaxID=2267521 RepID=UPI003C2FE740
MKKIFILGSGGFAKEVYSLIHAIGGYVVEGFIDLSAREPVQLGPVSLPVFAESYLEELTEKPALAIGVGDPKLIQKLVSKFGADHEFPNLLHPTVIGHFDDITFERGNIVTASCIFTISIKVGSFNIFNLNTTIGHDVVIGDCNVINPMVNISGGVTIGSGNLLGVNSTILQYKTIGNGSVIGASSLVTKDVEDSVLVLGVPAVKLKSL